MTLMAEQNAFSLWRHEPNYLHRECYFLFLGLTQYKVEIQFCWPLPCFSVRSNVLTLGVMLLLWLRILQKKQFPRASNLTCPECAHPHQTAVVNQRATAYCTLTVLNIKGLYGTSARLCRRTKPVCISKV